MIRTIKTYKNDEDSHDEDADNDRGTARRNTGPFGPALFHLPMTDSPPTQQTGNSCHKQDAPAPGTRTCCSHVLRNGKIDI